MVWSLRVMPWPPLILVQPPESVLVGLVQWRRRGMPLVTVIVKQRFSVGPTGIAQAEQLRPSDAMTGDDRVPFKPRVDLLVTPRDQAAAVLEVWRGGNGMLQTKLAPEAHVRRSVPPSARGPAATVIELPDPLDPRVFQIAPEDQQLDRVMPDDCIVVQGTTRAFLFCPRLDVTAHLRRRDGATKLDLNIDAIQWEVADERCTVVARAQASWSEDVDAVVVEVASRGVQPSVGVNPLPIKAHAPPPPAPAREGAAVFETSFSDSLSAVARAAATPFSAPAASRPVIPAAAPTGPHVDTGTVVADGSEIQRIARAIVAAKAAAASPPTPAAVAPQPPPASETAAFSPELMAFVKAQAKSAVPFAKSEPAAASPRAVLPAAPAARHVDTGTVVADGSEIQRLAQALKAAPHVDTGTVVADGSEIQRMAQAFKAAQQAPAPLPVAPAPLPATPPPAAPTPAPSELVARFLDAEPVELALDEDELLSP